MIRQIAIVINIMVFFGLTGLSVTEAQPRLERISISERADSQGYVLRYHLTGMVRDFNVLRPTEDLILMELSSPGFTVSRLIPITEFDLFSDIDLVEIDDGVGVIIQLAEGVHFKTDAYPDINGRDILLSLEIVTRDEALQQVSANVYHQWYDSDSEAQEIETRPSEVPVAREEQPSIQRTHSPGIKFGVLAGVSSANVFAADFNSNTRNGISFGLSADISLPFILPYNIHTGIETGIFFSQKGFKNPEPQFLTGVVFEFDYIEIPLLAKFKYEELDFISPYIMIGPSAGFMVNAERVLSDDERRDLDDRTKAADISAVAGVGVDIKIFDTTFSAQIRNSFGASNVFKDEPEIRDRVQFRHRHISMIVGVRF
jgi:hypothetical protein